MVFGNRPIAADRKSRQSPNGVQTEFEKPSSEEVLKTFVHMTLTALAQPSQPPTVRPLIGVATHD